MGGGGGGMGGLGGGRGDTVYNSICLGEEQCGFVCRRKNVRPSGEKCKPGCLVRHALPVFRALLQKITGGAKIWAENHGRSKDLGGKLSKFT